MKAIVSFHIDSSLIKKVCFFYLLVSITEILRVSYLGSIHNTQYEYTLYELVLIYIIDWFLVISYMLLISGLTKYFLDKGYHKIFIFFLHFIFATTLLFLTAFITPLVKSGNTIVSITQILNSFITSSTLNLLIYAVITLIIYNHFNLQNINDKQAKVITLQHSFHQLKMKLLKSQLEPHFLFNTLNNISSLTLFDPKKAQNMIADLSSFLRKALELHNYDLISVAKEVDMLSDYVSILMKRFESDLEVFFNIDPKALSIKVPGLILQPLLENSVKHGFSNANKKLIIWIDISLDDKALHLSVENNGKKIFNSGIQTYSGIGLINIYERLQGYYNNDFSLNIQNSKKGVLTHITIPVNVQK